MPFTFSHPAAILPLKRFFSQPLGFPALLLASVSPDFGYYIHNFKMASQAHTIIGGIAICLPTTVLLLAIYPLLARPIFFILPAPHRQYCTSCHSSGLVPKIKDLPFLAAAILLGAWSHILWDGFTHQNGLFVRYLPFLQRELLFIGTEKLYFYQVLQQSSTLIGGVILLWAYWCGFQVFVSQIDCDRQGNPWRYCLWVFLLLVPGAIGILFNYKPLVEDFTFFHVRAFLFKSTITYFSTFFTLLLPVAIALFVRGDRQSRVGKQ